MFRTLRTALAVTPVALLAACSSGASTPVDTLPANVDVQVNAVKTLRFDKADYGTVKAGDVVFFTVKDSSHSLHGIKAA